MAEIKFKKIDPSDKAEVIEALINYKRQNPTKYAMKEKELLARYGLEEAPAEVKDDSDIKLENLKKTAK